MSIFKMNTLRQILGTVVGALAMGFGLITFTSAALPALITMALSNIKDDLDAEWRRGRRQNWLWRWAKHAKGI